MKLDNHTISQIKKLEEKFKNSGQDLNAYLDGLLFDRYLTYWDYIHLDTLLSLQNPKTHFPDELIFITYHQITELYFKLAIHEIKQIIDNKALNATIFQEKVNRVIRYFRMLISSFEIMIRGMEHAQFLKYRMSLLPASGFQSVQFRLIEIYCTPLEHLAHPSLRAKLNKEASIEEKFEAIYWKQGATNLDNKEKTLTLKQFEERYTPRMLRLANKLQTNTLYHKYLQLPPKEKASSALISSLKTLDVEININWLLMHMGAAYRYLSEKGKVVDATGGTNWKAFLPPSFQKVHFFPNLWTENEKENWGREWVNHTFNTEKPQKK